MELDLSKDLGVEPLTLKFGEGIPDQTVTLDVFRFADELSSLFKAFADENARRPEAWPRLREAWKAAGFDLPADSFFVAYAASQRLIVNVQTCKKKLDDSLWGTGDVLPGADASIEV